MKDIWNGIQIAIAALGGVVGWFLGEMDGIIYALIAFAVVDYITGFIKAAVTGQLSSSVGAKGIAKKVALFLIVGIAHIADRYMLGDNGALRMAVIFFYLSNEGLSILENAGALGIPIPAKLTDMIAKLRDKPAEPGDPPAPEDREG